MDEFNRLKTAEERGNTFEGKSEKLCKISGRKGRDGENRTFLFIRGHFSKKFVYGEGRTQEGSM